MTSAFQQFDAWLEVHRYNDDPWADFDEFLRSILFQWTCGTHVRTYRLLSEGDELIPLREIATGDSPDVMSARRGIEGYVATTGRSYVAGDPTHGELVDQLAPTGAELNTQDSGLSPVEGGPAWCFGIVRGARKVGVVTVGRFDGAGGSGWPSEETATGACPWTLAQLRLVELVIAQFWNALTEVCRSRAALMTDPGSDGLTRKAFFEIGREVLADAYRKGEPVAVAMIGVEGLRGLDDEGQWEAADDIRAMVSGVLKERLRSEDRLGRFDDSRFVLLLRRVDSELAMLIAKELMSRLSSVLASRRSCRAGGEIRCGLAGSGVTGEGLETAKPSLEKLVATAVASCQEARQASVTLASDLHPAGCPGNGG